MGKFPEEICFLLTEERGTYLYAVHSSFCLDTSTLLGFDELPVYENDLFNQTRWNRTRGIKQNRSRSDSL